MESLRSFVSFSGGEISKDTKSRKDVYIVTKTRNGEPGTGNGERESGNDCTAEIPIRIQNRQFSHLFLGLRFGI